MMKLKDLLVEKVDLDQRIVDKIAKLTDINNHNEARIVLAKEMKLKNLVKVSTNLVSKQLKAF